MSYYDPPDDPEIGTIDGPAYYWVYTDQHLVEEVYPVSDFGSITDLFLLAPLDLSTEDSTLSVRYGYRYTLGTGGAPYDEWYFSYTEDDLPDKLADLARAEIADAREANAEARREERLMEGSQ